MIRLLWISTSTQRKSKISNSKLTLWKCAQNPTLIHPETTVSYGLKFRSRLNMFNTRTLWNWGDMMKIQRTWVPKPRGHIHMVKLSEFRRCMLQHGLSLILCALRWNNTGEYVIIAKEDRILWKSGITENLEQLTLDSTPAAQSLEWWTECNIWSLQ